MVKKDIIIILIIVLVIVVLTILSYKKEDTTGYDMEIYFFNAGKADAILITHNEKHILVDTGEESFGDEILAYLMNHNINKLDYLIITHFDKDHVGGAKTIIDNIEIGEVLETNYIKESEYYWKYKNALSDKDIIPVEVETNYNLSFENNNGFKMSIEGPQKIYDSNESNNSSLIVSIIYNNTKFLLTGDIQNARIKDFVSTNQVTYDFIKIPYHGRYQKRLDDLLDNVKPKYGVMTCSKTEGCESETIEVLASKNIKYYMTKNGSIRVLSNGEDIKIIN